MCTMYFNFERKILFIRSNDITIVEESDWGFAGHKLRKKKHIRIKNRTTKKIDILKL